MLFIEGIEDYSAYESCLILGLDVDDYAMEAIDFGKMKETVSKKFQDVKDWISQKWESLKETWTGLVSKVTGFFSKNKVDTASPTKDDQKEMKKLKKRLVAASKSQKVIDEVANDYLSMLRDMKDMNPNNADASDEYVTHQYQKLGQGGKADYLTYELDGLEKFAESSEENKEIAQDLSFAVVNAGIKEGQRILKIGDVMMKTTFQKLISAIKGEIKSTDSQVGKEGMAFKIIVKGLNIIGSAARFIIKMVTYPIRLVQKAFNKNEKADPMKSADHSGLKRTRSMRLLDEAIED